MRLIDADALMESAKIFEAKCLARNCGKSILTLARIWLFNEVEKAPTIDAVEVVRCKDCIGKTIWYKNDYDCTICGLSGMFVKGDTDFCSCGERRSDG